MNQLGPLRVRILVLSLRMLRCEAYTASAQSRDRSVKFNIDRPRMHCDTHGPSYPAATTKVSHCRPNSSPDLAQSQSCMSDTLHETWV